MDCELVLRFLAIWKNWDRNSNVLENYKGRMKSFLNLFMNENKNLSKNVLDRWFSLFNETVDKAVSVYGENAFKRRGLDGTCEKTINRAIMDVIMLSCTQHSLNELLSKKEVINQRFLELINENIEFKNSIKIGTSDTKVITYRLSTWCDEVDSILAANK